MDDPQEFPAWENEGMPEGFELIEVSVLRLVPDDTDPSKVVAMFVPLRDVTEDWRQDL